MKKFISIYFAILFIYGILVRHVKSMECNEDYPTYKGGVVTNGQECAKIGSDVLLAGGSAADAAIAALLCEGVSLPASSGLGGGFLMTIYTRETGEVVTLNAREQAPNASTPNMFANGDKLAQKGVLSIAIPGELMGMWELHQRFGKLAWKSLLQPTIQLCRDGVKVTKYFNNVLQIFKEDIQNSPSLKELFVNPKTNDIWKIGDKIKRFQLAETLEIIAVEGASALYNGSLTEMFVSELRDMGGIIKTSDMRNYKAKWDKPISTKLLDKYSFYSVPFPGSGVILCLTLNIIDGFLDLKNFDTVTNWQRIVESFKFAYGPRTQLGDIKEMEELMERLSSKTYATELKHSIGDDWTSEDTMFYFGANYSNVNADHGTGLHGGAHVAILAPNGDAISVTSTINWLFGSNIISRVTGILLNDEMNDFSAPHMMNAYNVPPSPANYVRPGKRPLSSMSSTLIIDNNGDVRLVIGASGGSRTMSSLALLIIWNVFLDRSISDTIEHSRLHHQLFPMEILYEIGFNMVVVKGLTKIGHNRKFINLSDGFAVATAIARQCNTLYGKYDERRQGSVYLI